MYVSPSIRHFYRRVVPIPTEMLNIFEIIEQRLRFLACFLKYVYDLFEAIL